MTDATKPKGIDIDTERKPLDKRTPAELREAEARTIAQRDGWREIAEAMLTTAFGVPMKGHSDIPPIELLDAVRGKGEHEVIDALSAGILGRAWRIAGTDGEGRCDYPLCAHRDLEKRPMLTSVELRKSGEAYPVARLRVCSADVPALSDRHGSNECRAWAEWVSRRLACGRIEVRR